MDKIVIVTNKPEPDYGLLAMLNTLFPDCEIRIVPRGVETCEEGLAGSSSGPFMTDTMGRA